MKIIPRESRLKPMCRSSTSSLLSQVRRDEETIQRHKSANQEQREILLYQKAQLEARRQEERQLREEEAKLVVSALFKARNCENIAHHDFLSKLIEIVL